MSGARTHRPAGCMQIRDPLIGNRHWGDGDTLPHNKCRPLHWMSTENNKHFQQTQHREPRRSALNGPQLFLVSEKSSESQCWFVKRLLKSTGTYTEENTSKFHCERCEASPQSVNAAQMSVLRGRTQPAPAAWRHAGIQNGGSEFKSLLRYS